MQSPNVLNFLQEFLQRLFTKSPKFFKVWQIISGALVLITGIPEFLNALPFHINIPDLFNVKLTAAIAWASRAALLMSLLTTQSKPIGVTDNGTVVKSTSEKDLPFTAASEQQSAVKHDIAPVEVTRTAPIEVTPTDEHITK